MCMQQNPTSADSYHTSTTHLTTCAQNLGFLIDTVSMPFDGIQLTHIIRMVELGDITETLKPS
jgi:hypothetical protein